MEIVLIVVIYFFEFFYKINLLSSSNVSNQFLAKSL